NTDAAGVLGFADAHPNPHRAARHVAPSTIASPSGDISWTLRGAILMLVCACAEFYVNRAN
ncbi:MAG TPA: hypothetical protein VK832_19515, partial [Burkholderiaceae bacterium]|nr:hypothetical protein [Burkholderiaceae bacterium]